MSELDLTPTYDVLKTSLPTGDQRDATIDYVLLRAASNYSVKQHYTRELNSDHDLLVADAAVLKERVGSWGSGTVVSDPRVSPYKVEETIVRAIDGIPTGGVLHLTARTIYGGPTVDAIKRARARGVQIQLVFGDRTPTRAIKAFQRMLGKKTTRKSWAVNRPRPYGRQALPPVHLLASVSSGTPALRIDVDRTFEPNSYGQPMVARIYTDGVAYDGAFRRFFAAAGRPL